MKWRIFILFFLIMPLLALQCNRDLPYTPPPPIDPNPPVHKIEMSRRMVIWNLGTEPGQTTMEFSQDSNYVSNVFYLVGTPYLPWSRPFITFTYRYNNLETIVKKVYWKIGAERILREGETTAIEFQEPDIIPVECRVTRQIMKRGYAQPTQTDTLRDTLRLIGLENALPLRYRGVNSDNLQDTFTIEFGYGTEPLLPLFQQDRFLYVSNLPKGFPYKHFGYLSANAVWFDNIVGWRRPKYQGLYTSAMKGFGYSTQGIDSVYITQTFTVNTVEEDNENNRGRTLHFKGKRVQ
ncbi:hypothetical protein [Phnomibacter sp. MR]|uniref:hypothetical protein n=1 Tax=Phnomibacter sp. MR TaxID=3042318 RepID=UPI003A808A9A